LGQAERSWLLGYDPTDLIWQLSGLACLCWGPTDLPGQQLLGLVSWPVSLSAWYVRSRSLNAIIIVNSDIFMHYSLRRVSCSHSLAM
jgi:hypothetical protein